jgi:hypothetical protein
MLIEINSKRTGEFDNSIYGRICRLLWEGKPAEAEVKPSDLEEEKLLVNSVRSLRAMATLSAVAPKVRADLEASGLMRRTRPVQKLEKILESIEKLTQR